MLLAEKIAGRLPALWSVVGFIEGVVIGVLEAG